MPLGKTSLSALGFLALLAPAVQAQGVAFQPGIGSFPDGAMLSATPVVSADRRYVRLTLNPQFTSLEGFNNYTVPAAVSGGSGGLGAGGLAGFAGVNGPMAGLGMPAAIPGQGAPPPPAAGVGGMSSDPFQAALARSADSRLEPGAGSMPQDERPAVSKKGARKRTTATSSVRARTKRRP